MAHWEVKIVGFQRRKHFSRQMTGTILLLTLSTTILTLGGALPETETYGTSRFGTCHSSQSYIDTLTQATYTRSARAIPHPIIIPANGISIKHGRQFRSQRKN